MSSFISLRSYSVFVEIFTLKFFVIAFTSFCLVAIVLVLYKVAN